MLRSRCGSSQIDPMESLLPKLWLVAHGAKDKMTFDETDVTCKHSETLGPFSCLLCLEMIRNCKNSKGTSFWKFWGLQVSKIWLHVMWYRISPYLYLNNTSFGVGKKMMTKIIFSRHMSFKIRYETARCYAQFHLSLVTRKPVFGVSDQVRLKPAYSATKTS